MVPAFLSPAKEWSDPWKGYSTSTPPDVDNTDIGNITEKAAWDKYALKSRMNESGAIVGVLSFAHGLNTEISYLIGKGNVWEMVAGGQSFVYWKKNETETVFEQSLMNVDCNDYLIVSCE